MRHENIMTLQFTSEADVSIFDSPQIHLTRLYTRPQLGVSKSIEYKLNIIRVCRSYILVLYTPSHNSQGISNRGNGLPACSCLRSERGGDGLPLDNGIGGEGSPKASLIRSPAPIGEIPLWLLPNERLC
jgi:hypothetical protein